MDNRTLRETFDSLLTSGQFTNCIEENGYRYRQAHFYSSKLILRIAEQQEITRQGASVTFLAFLIDPHNSSRWCMLEKATDEMLGRKIEGSSSLLELHQNIDDNIGSILDQIDQGHEPPFQDFSQFR
jgi:hypothetical protein